MLDNSKIRSELEKNPNIDNSRIDFLIDTFNLLTKGYDKAIFKKDKNK